MDFLSPDNAWVAFLAGVITSPHCLLMCGPLAYVMLSGSVDDEPDCTDFLPHLLYNSTRVFAFTAIGVLAGILGLGILKFIQFPIIKFFPWVLVVFFIIFALGFDRLIPKMPFARKIFARLSERIVKLPKNFAAILLGLATPFLPCGPLYMIFWVALLSGSPLFGAEITFGFALGTLPLMLLASTQFKRLKGFFTPKSLYFVQRFTALIAACFLTWRLLANDGPLSAAFCCPW